MSTFAHATRQPVPKSTMGRLAFQRSVSPMGAGFHGGAAFALGATTTANDPDLDGPKLRHRCKKGDKTTVDMAIGRAMELTQLAVDALESPTEDASGLVKALTGSGKLEPVKALVTSLAEITRKLGTNYESDVPVLCAEYPDIAFCPRESLIAGVPGDSYDIWGRLGIVVCKDAFKHAGKGKGIGSDLDGQAFTLIHESAHVLIGPTSGPDIYLGRSLFDLLAEIGQGAALVNPDTIATLVVALARGNTAVEVESQIAAKRVSEADETVGLYPSESKLARVAVAVLEHGAAEASEALELGIGTLGEASPPADIVRATTPLKLLLLKYGENDLSDMSKGYTNLYEQLLLHKLTIEGGTADETTIDKSRHLVSLGKSAIPLSARTSGVQQDPVNPPSATVAPAFNYGTTMHTIKHLAEPFIVAFAGVGADASYLGDMADALVNVADATTIKYIVEDEPQQIIDQRDPNAPKPGINPSDIEPDARWFF